MKHYDVDAIYDRLSGREVAEMLGLPINGKGDVICPSPEHDDRHLGNCHLTPKGCRCFACNQTFGLVDMVMKVRGVNYVNALKELSNYAGLTAESNFKKSYVKMPLTTEEFELLGIKKSYAALKPGKYSDSKPSDSKKYIRDAAGGYISQEVGWKNPVMDIYQNDPDTFWRIIEGKAREKLSNITSVMKIPGLPEEFYFVLFGIKQKMLSILERRTKVEVAA